ncbi:MAG: glycosyltransferase 87 family protein [Acidimicrobiales bacterium]
MLTDRLRTHRSASSPGDERWGRYPPSIRRTLEAAQGMSPQWRDAFLYACSALFAGVTALSVGIPLYRQWGQLAFGPYLAAAVLMAVVAWRVGRGAPGRGWRAARVAAFLIVLFGATVVPLALEVVWRSEGNPSLHVQPEVVVVEQAGVRAAHGRDPYREVDRDGHILIHEKTEPIYELYYPYLPGMVLFGLSSSDGGSKIGARLTDARIQFLLFTGVITLFALSRLRPATDARFRSLQVLTVLPTAAIPLATGGDDMPVVALMLLGVVALQRRRPLLAGLALGAASSLKFTAWPLAVLALWAATDLQRRRALGRYVLGVAAVTVPVVVPVALRNTSAFVDNVIRFPLGLAGVSSPAASALPGHALVSVFPREHRLYVVVVGVVGCAVLVRHLLRNPPRHAAGVAALTGWVMLIAILLAPATRVGYLLYPINLFVWAWMLNQADDPVGQGGREPLSVGQVDAAGPAMRSDAGQVSSDISSTSMENGVVPADVVGDTTTPASQ